MNKAIGIVGKVAMFALTTLAWSPVHTSAATTEPPFEGDTEVAEFQASETQVEPSGRPTEPKATTDGNTTSSALLETVTMRAKQELSRAVDLLNTAQDYNKKDQVTAAQEKLTLALDWNNATEIQAKTQALAALNLELEELIQHQKAERRKSLLSGSDDGAATGRRVEPTTSTPQVSASSANQSTASGAESSTTNRTTPSHSHTLRNIVLVLIGLDWLYCFSQGLQNRIVLYFNGKDVFISILGPALLFVAFAEKGDIDSAIVGLLAISGAICAVITIVSSVKHNQGLLVGCLVALFKLSFSFLWFALLFGQLVRGGDDKKGSYNNFRETFIGILIAILLWKLMKKLINGRAVYATNGWTV